MKKFKTWRYKCDFCGKNGYQAASMRKHEEGCTANPDRICRVHKYVTGGEEPTVPKISDLIAVLQAHKYDIDHGLKELREAADDCPCCILAALRQSGFSKGYYDGEVDEAPLIGKEQFDFQAELKSLWSEVNEAQRSWSEYGY